MSDKVYQNRSILSSLPREVVNEITDKVIFAQNNTGHKVAKRLGVSPQLLDQYTQKRKKEVANNA